MMDSVIKIPTECKGRELYQILLDRGIPFSAPCGGNGTCGKCRVKLLEGSVCDREGKPVSPDAEGCVLACRVYIAEGGCTVSVPTLSGDGLTVSSENSAVLSQKLGIALDIGTTTLAAALVDLESGSVLKSASTLNPEAPFGADVMSRIVASHEGKLRDMQTLLLASVGALITELTAGKDNAIDTLVAVGNPTMVHIFLGVSPEGIGQYPFTPAFVSTQRRSGEELGLPCKSVTVMPSASAFIGGDVIAGAILHQLDQADDPKLLLDIGTNGEIILVTGKTAYATSSAAGPALEGARISSGMGGVSGAVSSVFEKDGSLIYKTVKNAEAKGICGAGLVDLTAHLLEKGILEEDGYLEEDIVLTGRHLTSGGLSPEQKTAVLLTGGDIRELQLAKSAIRAGVETLLDTAGHAHAVMTAFFLAGGLGYYLSPDSACRIGLFAKDLCPVLKSVGNSALEGAVAALCEEDFIPRAEAFSRSLQTVDLNDSVFFSEAFVEYMFFGE